MQQADAIIGVDVGGTFTDIAVEYSGRRVTHKVLSTRAPEEGICDGIEQALGIAEIAPERVGLVIHGTTLLTNALIERRGPKVAFLTTAGHRDTLEIASESRFLLYDLDIEKPAPIVPREWRLPIRERLDVSGRVLVPLDEDDVARCAERIVGHGIASVAIGFLHSYANADHERRAAEILRSFSRDLSISLSSQVSPEIREYDRFSTVCANAFVKPIAAAYLTGLRARLGRMRIACPLLLMHSGGGMIDVDTAIEQPIRLLESGPAGGAVFAATIARELGIDRALCFDMGGSTAKICFIDDYRPRTARVFEVDRVYRFLKGSGLPVRIPVIELVEIGAGGGSIAGIDRMGGLTVGPESAGADPGPACFGKGGDRATVTDANLVLGRIRPEHFAGGMLQPDTATADRVLAGAVGAPLGLDACGAALGVVEIVDENMANAARVHALENGRDLSRYTLIAFGGAGPLHAARLAAKLDIDRVVVPADAGVGSAIGFLRAPLTFELVRSQPVRLAAYDAGAVASLVDEMSRESASIIARAGAGGEVQRSVGAFMRYVGQGHELEIEFPAWLEPPARATLRERFEAAYETMFARRLPQQEVEILSWRVRSTLPVPARAAEADAPGGGMAARSAPVIVDSAGTARESAILDKRSLAAEARVDGPAVIVDRGTTILVPPRVQAVLSQGRHVILTRDRAAP